MKVTKPRFNSDLVNAKNIKIMIGLFFFLVAIIIFAALRDTDALITHKQANALYTQNKIKKVIIDGNYIKLKTSDSQYKIYKEAINTTTFFSKFPVEIKEKNNSFNYIFVVLFSFLVLALLYKLIQQNKLYQLKQIRATQKNEESGESLPVQAISSTVTFEDVAGIKDVKEELEEIIDFLKAPQKYRDLDIRLPQGVLLVGPPGVGKTLIAKAVAGEANVPFFYQSGATFVQIYVGMGAKRVSELFRKAKQSAPSIIFIDEIDAVGKSRGELRNDEREATLNQLLTEMDGFEDSSGVIIIGATNKVDMLDEALLRAGRFDRRIHISLPDLEDRSKTLELYLANKPNDVNISEVSRMTVGFNAAALDTLTNEAAIYAMREGRNTVTTNDFEIMKDKVLLGKRKIRSFTDKEREIQAIYQGAKAVIATWLDVDFEKIGIVNTRLMSQEHEILSRSQLLSRIKVYLAGSLATKIHYNEQFTNAGTDISHARELIKKVIYEYAMSDNFSVSAQEEESLMRDLVSEVTALLRTLDVALTEVSSYLLKYENISNEDCKEILRNIF